MLKRWRLRRSVPAMDHGEAMLTLRRLAYGGSSDRKTMTLLAERAVVTAPDGMLRDNAERWAVPLRAGRPVRVKSGGQILSIGGVSVELIDAVNEVFEQGEQ
jgi:hypothetical protein